MEIHQQLLQLPKTIESETSSYLVGYTASNETLLHLLCHFEEFIFTACTKSCYLRPAIDTPF